MTLRDDAENAGAAIEPTGASARPLAKAARIFLADDADEMRELIGFALEQDGYDVVEARDGREMLRLIRDAIFAETVRPDVIVTDTRMPGCSGLKLLAVLRRARWSTPVILITAFADEALRQEAKELGAAAVFEKPFDVDDLRTVVLHLYQNHTSQSAGGRMQDRRIHLLHAGR